MKNNLAKFFVGVMVLIAIQLGIPLRTIYFNRPLNYEWYVV